MKERFMTTAQRVAMHRVLTEVEFERMEQHFKWGEQNRPSFSAYWLDDPSIAAAADAAKSYADRAMKRDELCYADILCEEYLEAQSEHHDEAALRRELIQVAAVAVAWIEAIDRRTNGNA